MTLNTRMTTTTAVACVLVSTVLLPLFSDILWFVIAAGVVIAVAGTGALTRLRALPVSVLKSSVASCWARTCCRPVTTTLITRRHNVFAP